MAEHLAASRMPPLRTSIVIATHNGERFILEQLRSLENQTLKPYEIIVSDDSSKDRTETIVSQFAHSSDIPVRIYKNVLPLGFADNFLTGAQYASGELIAFCDQDDVWRSNKIFACANAFRDENVVLTVHAARLIDENNRPVGHFDQGIQHDCLRNPLSFAPWGVFFGFSMVFRRELLTVIPNNQRGVDYITGKHRLAHDRWILYLANMLGYTRQIPDELVDYRQHGGNLFGVGFKRKNRAFGDIRRESELYVRAAVELRALIDMIEDSAKCTFPMFDRASCQSFWDMVISQQAARRDLYFSGSMRRSWGAFLQNMRRGVYLNPHDNRLRWRSALKDFYYTVFCQADAKVQP
jgi:glycosyltransferase involved in cell wall biosynthesis